jgi:hypothetical protein
VRRSSGIESSSRARATWKTGTALPAKKTASQTFRQVSSGRAFMNMQRNHWMATTLTSTPTESRWAARVPSRVATTDLKHCWSVRRPWRSDVW